MDTSAEHVITGNTAKDWEEVEDKNTQKIYYWNRITHAVQWDKPQVLIDAEKLKASSTLECAWKEFKQADTGKKYYYNAETGKSQWVMPEEYRTFLKQRLIDQSKDDRNVLTTSGQISASLAVKNRMDTSHSGDSSSNIDNGVDSQQEQQKQPPPPSEKEEEPKEVKSTESAAAPDKGNENEKPFDQEKAVATFRQLLDDTKIPVDMDWNTAIKKLANDDRFKSLRTHAERRNVFEQYIEDRKDQERKDALARRRKMETDFFDMLSGLSGDDTITYDTSYRHVSQTVGNDPRFLAVENAKERLELYDRFLRDLERRERREKEERRKRAMDEFRHLLVQRAEMGHIKYDMLWRDVKEQLKDQDLYQSLEEVDRYQVWDDFIKDLTKIEEEKHLVEREQKKRKHILHRANLWKLLEQSYAQGNVTVSTPWRTVRDSIKDQETYIAVENDKTSIRPRDVFEEFVEELEELFQEDMKVLKKIMRDRDFTIKADTTFEDYIAVVSKDERFKSLHNAQNAKIYHEDILEMIEEDKERRKKRRLGRLKELFRETPGITADTTYDKAKKILSHSSTFEKFEKDDDLRQQIFEEHIQKLKRRLESSNSSSDANSMRKRKRESQERYRGPSREHDPIQEKRARHQQPVETTKPSSTTGDQVDDEFQRKIEKLAKRKDYLMSLKRKGEGKHE